MHTTILGLFKHVDEAAEAVKPLEELSIKHEDMKLLSLAPYPNGTLFTDHTPAPVWRYALVCGVLGFLAGIGLAGGTQVLLNLNVGSKPPFSYPAVGIMCYELALAGAVLGTFFGMLKMAGLPDWTAHAYDIAISNGNVGLLVRCEDETTASRAEEIMKARGAWKTRKGRDDF